MEGLDHSHKIDDRQDDEHIMHEVAIIGMAGRFPGAENLEAFWDNLCNGVESITFFGHRELLEAGVTPALLANPNYVKAGAILANIDRFDAIFFGFSPSEASVMDPQLRFFIECAWEALENAGYVPENFSGSIGVYAGTGTSGYQLANIYAGARTGGMRLGNNLFTVLVNDKDYLTTHVSYKLNLTGPSICVQTACSTSLVAVHLASQSLLNGECDMALAGGVSVGVPQKQGYLYEEGSILSPDGHCRAFDAQARGTVLGSGVGIVVLKRLQDAMEEGDHIYAVIKGTAVNNDGSLKVGYVAPSVDGQTAVIREALTLAGCDPDDISYVETHGTGTAIGDPIEIAALIRAFNREAGSPRACGIGSVKTNIGHVGMAAGVAGLIKTTLALNHRQIPPSLNFEKPNPEIDFASSPFYVVTQREDWHADGKPRRAGVSSFGVGGTNAHVILEEPPELQAAAPARSLQLLVLSARSEAAFDAQATNLVSYLERHPDLSIADVAYTLHLGRRHFHHRCAVLCRDVNDAIAALAMREPGRVRTSTVPTDQQKVVFMFPGQGTQYLGMGKECYQTEPVFRQEIDRWAERLRPMLDLDLRTLLFSPEDDEASEQLLRQTSITQPALFVIEYALAKLWMTWGITPEVMIGHSIGEYVAACLAGVMTPEDALALVTVRGRLMQNQPQGAMLAVSLPEGQALDLLNDRLSLAAINGPTACVIAGPRDAIKELKNQLCIRNVDCRLLHTSHAFHSSMMDAILKRYRDEVRKIGLNPPQIPFISNLTGTWITSDQATDVNYWVRHMREPVRFAVGVSELLKETSRIFLEVGPGRALTSLCQQQIDAPSMRLLACLPYPQEKTSETALLLETLGKLFLLGVEVNWHAFYAAQRRRRMPLPTYPFERKRYWAEPRPVPASAAPPQTQGQEIALQNLNRNIAEYDHGVTSKNGLSSGQAEPCSVTHKRPPLGYAYVAPRNDIEQTIAEIWQQFLGIEQVGIYDPFFELGGSSLGIVEVQQRLQEAFNMDVPLQTLLENQTVADLTQPIIQLKHSNEVNGPLAGRNHQARKQPREAGSWQTWEQARLPIVPLQLHGTKAPFFCVHPLTGTVFPYYELSTLLDVDRPLYGIQSFGPDGELHHERTIEDMAAYYLESLRKVQPESPYYLGGWSFGSLVAYEIARQLTGMGQVVNFVGLIDTPTPRSTSLTKNLRMAYETIRDVWPFVYDYWYLSQHISRRSITISPLLWASVVNTMATLKYRPKPYPGRVTLLRTGSTLGKQSKDLTWGWGTLASGGVQVLSIPGSHMTLVKKPYVESLACQLTACLDKYPE